MNRSVAYAEDLPPGDQPHSLGAGLVQASSMFPSGGFAFISPLGDSFFSTYGNIFTRAQHILCGLRRTGTRPGDKLVLYFRECQDFIPTLWAAILAGAIPLPLMRNDSNRRHLARTSAMFAHLRTILAGPLIISDLPENEWQAVDGLDAGDVVSLPTLEGGGSAEDFFEGSLHDPRLLVLSSGTSGLPKIVTLSAWALINRWWPTMPDRGNAATFLSWSPFDHVMGLGFVSPNLPSKVHLPTGTFVRSPTQWLSALDRFQVTHCTMTNFGMSLIVRAMEERIAGPHRPWDLSAVRKIGVGAEAVSPDVCRRFIGALEPYGLRPDAVILGYGLTECGPVVGGTHAFSADGDRQAGPFALLDTPTRGHAVRIVNETAELVEEGAVGAIEVHGPTMTVGYYGDEPATRELFTADGWIRTGDLGRLDAGRLTVTGREKEIIVIHAKKYACAEIEMIAERVSGVEAAFAAPGSVPGGSTDKDESQFALFFVPSLAARNDLGRVTAALRTAMASRFGISPGYLVPIDAEEVPRTSTGKVRRLELTGSLEKGDLGRTLANFESMPQAVYELEARTGTEQKLASIWAKVLGFEVRGRNVDFFDAGGDSLSVEVLIVEIDQAFGKNVPSGLIRRNTTIARLAEFIDSSPNGASTSSGAASLGAAAKQGDRQNQSSPRFTGIPPSDGSSDLRLRKRNAETLARARAIAESPAASFYEKLAAIEVLVANGVANHADALIRNVDDIFHQRREPRPRFLDMFIAINERFRGTGIDQAVHTLGDLGEKLLSSDEETVLWTTPGASRLVVVFNTKQGDFWVSGPVLHCLLRNNLANILYLKDPSGRNFAGGLKGFGGDFDSLVSAIATVAEQHAVQDILVTGFSSGGYAALLAASKLRAASYLGFSIRNPSPGATGSVTVDQSQPGIDRFADCAPLAGYQGRLRRGVLYYGENDLLDATHAGYFADIPNVVVKKVPRSGHNTIATLLADGEFERIFTELLV